jgi:thymidylate synthase ThyX
MAYDPRIERYVSSTTADVFAITGLPEEVIAVLFARYSRSSASLRELLSTMLAGEEIEHAGPTEAFSVASEKARAFHEKYVLGYGHGSVAEHAVVHLAIENVSIIASKALEDARLASYTEKSTRYVQFTSESLYVPEMCAELKALYIEATSNLYRLYGELLPQAMEAIEAQAPDGTSRDAIKAQALDAVRGLLPAGTRTNIGMTVNARSLAHILVKLGSSPLQEVQDLAVKMRAAASPIVPTLLKYTDPSPFIQSHRDRVMASLPPQLAANFDAAHVRIIRHDEDAIERIALSLLAEVAGEAWYNNTVACSAENLGKNDCEQIVLAAIKRRGAHDAVPRAFEATSFLVRLLLDYGAYRDLQRHRMLSPASGLLTARHGFNVPPLVKSIGRRDDYVAAMVRARDAWQQLYGSDRSHAQYVVPLGFRHQVFWTLNLREMFHVIELRSARQGHPSYREVAQRLYHAVCTIHPWLKDLIRVDLNDYTISRK